MQIPSESQTSPLRTDQYTPARPMRVPNPIPLPKIQPTDETSQLPPDLDSSIRNIIVFGETGVGKSSIINMLQGEAVAATSNSAYGCTSTSNCHEVTLATATGDQKYRLWDTSGLNEGDEGTVPAQKAISNLVALVRQLSTNENRAGGVSLLVYCIRGARVRDIIRVNYDLFWGVICSEKVPIVLVITGLENEDVMDNWWGANRTELEEGMGMKFDGHACVTSTKGKVNKAGRYTFDEEYQESVGKVRDLLERHCASDSAPLKIEGEMWISSVEKRLKQYMLEYNRRTGQERRVFEEENDNSRGGASGGWMATIKANWAPSDYGRQPSVNDHQSPANYRGSSYGSRDMMMSNNRSTRNPVPQPLNRATDQQSSSTSYRRWF